MTKRPTRFGRRAFLSAAGGVAAAAAFNQACRLAGEVSPASGAGTPRIEASSSTPAPSVPAHTRTPESLMGKVVLIRTADRAAGVQRALEVWGANCVRESNVFLKPNFNSADPAPGSTHLDTLRALVERIWAMGAVSIRMGDRSGMGVTRTVMQALGVTELAAEMGIVIEDFDELAADGWIQLPAPPGSQWSRGFAIARSCLEADVVVQTCNLKTHRYGGHFSLSLKNSVGLAARRLSGESHDYMSELHGSPHQRTMIADLNAAYSPCLILLDGIQAFRDGGPDKGTMADAHVMLAAADRIAIDAAGVAILRDLGTTAEVARGRIFQQEQLARAVELGLGVETPQQIEFLTDDADGRAYADRLRSILEAEGA